jgi:Uma2 family endonuclease
MSRPLTPDIDLDRPSPPPGPVSWEEFLAWATREDVRAEWVDSAIEVMESMSFEHQAIMLWLSRLLADHVETAHLGVVTLPLPMRLPSRHRGRSPDILFLTTEHLHRIQATCIDGPADLVVEIVSPDSIERDTETKLTEYAAGEVPEYWLINPLTQQATFYQRQPDGRYQPAAIDSDGVVRSAVVAGFWLRVDWLWQRPLPALAVVQRLYQER